MSEDKIMYPYGCPYCGQTVMVNGSDDPDQLRQQAIDACTCEGAKKERRIRLRNIKKEKYLQERFTDHPVREFIAQCIDAVDTWDTGIDYVQVKMNDGYTHKFYLSKDYDLKIKATKKNEEEITI